MLLTHCPAEDLHPALAAAAAGGGERCALVELEYPDEALKCIRILNRGQDWRVALRIAPANRQNTPPESRPASGRNTPSNFGADGEPKQRGRHRALSQRSGRTDGSGAPSRTQTPSSLCRSNSASPMTAMDDSLRQRCASLDTARGRAVKDTLQSQQKQQLVQLPSSPQPAQQQQQQQQQQDLLSAHPDGRARSSTIDSDWRRAHMKQSPLSRIQTLPADRQVRSADSSPQMQRRPMTLSPTTAHARPPSSSVQPSSPTLALQGERASPSPASFGVLAHSDAARASPRPFSPMQRNDDCVVRQPHGPSPSQGFSRGRGKPLSP